MIVGLPAFFPDSPEVALLTSGVGLLVLLLYFPGGLVQLLYSARDAVFGVLAARLPEAEPEPRPAATRLSTSAAADAGGPGDGDAAVPALRVTDVTVRFGVRTVVDAVSLEVRPGEVVGLIGANGAGKSTLMNAVGGFVRSTGERRGVRATGHRAARPTGGPPSASAASFQDAALFPDLTVRETVAVAPEARHHVGLATVAVGLPRARRVERAKLALTDDVLGFLGLGPYADRFVERAVHGHAPHRRAGVPAGDRGAACCCLDEPTAGVAQREAEAFGPLMLPRPRPSSARRCSSSSTTCRS